MVQSQTAFTIDEDIISPHKLFCDLAKEWIRIHGKQNSRSTRTFGIEYEERGVPNSCFGGFSRGEIGLTYIEQMFEQYPDLPKFAFINALAAHE